jgi:hypothetical protein
VPIANEDKKVSSVLPPEIPVDASIDLSPPPSTSSSVPFATYSKSEVFSFSSLVIRHRY